MPSRPLPLNALGKSLLTLQKEDALMLLLVRHGQPGSVSRPNPALKDFLGRPLTSTGRGQARRLAGRLAQLPLAHLYCSDMSRSYQTAKALHDLRPDLPLEIRQEIREVCGFHNPRQSAARKAADRQQVADECLAVTRFARQLRKRHKPGQIVAVIAHGDLNNLLLATLAGSPSRQHLRFAQDHTSVSVVNLWPNGHLHLALANCTRHLPLGMLGTPNLQ